MCSAWLGKIAQLLPFRVRADIKYKRDTITRRVRLETDTFKECHVREVRRERSFWREDRVDIVHKEPGGDIKYTPLK